MTEEADQKHGKEETDSSHLLPGLKPVIELLEASPGRIDCVFVRKGRHLPDADRLLDLCRQAGVRFSLLDPVTFAKVCPGKNQGVAARLYSAGFVEVADLIASAMEAPLPLVVVLDQVQDPGNAGTLARTLYAMGGAGLVVPRHNGVYLGAAAAKASAGALELLPVAKAANLGQALDLAAEHGFTLYGAEGGALPSLEARQSACGVFSLKPLFPAMLILGSEESGIRPSIRKRCDCLISIPLARNFDSLNVAQAGAIIIGAFSRQASVERP